ncbi:MAG: PDZ domain-containing protein [Algicola sp.]|nr:PDZ domain-containing protein [Algicola sp.]
MCCFLLSFGQGAFNMPGKKSDKIKFQLINNLIILPIELNGVPLSFLLDTGVSKPILFNITNTDSLQIKNVETVYLRGLGGGEPIEALKSSRNFFKLGDAININQDIYVVFDDSINFTSRLGVDVHGIIGYDIFKNFIVEINYVSQYIKLNKPESYKYRRCKKCEEFNLSFYNNKPYVEAEVKIDTSFVPVNLLIDTGSSDALWLFEDETLGIQPLQNKMFHDFLGKGLSGNVYGERSKVKTFKLKSFELRNVNAAFPDSASISHARKLKGRNGSFSGELLKRYHHIFDFQRAKITMKKNGNFNAPFYYNRSGIILEQSGFKEVREEEDRSIKSYGTRGEGNTQVDLSKYYKYSLKPIYSVFELRKGSPAEKAGIMVGDVILSINGKKTSNLKLQNIVRYFKNDVGKLIRLTVDRNGQTMYFQFKLENVFKQKKLP